MTKVDIRLRRLKDILKVRGYVSVRELSQMLGVSEMTVRRDFKQLEMAQTATNVNGVLVMNNPETVFEQPHYDLLEEVDKHKSSKERIGRLAASLVEEGDIIAIDTGSTTEKIVPFLPNDKNLTVLCYNINILIDLYKNPGINMMFAGGYYHANTQMFASEQGVQFINGIRAQKAFISAAGIHQQLGLTCANAYEVPTKQAVLNSSLHKILVADSSKFNAVRSSYFCDFTNINEIVTDNNLSDDWRHYIISLGIKLHTT